MRVLLATSWDEPAGCGIQEHSRSLIEAVQAADPAIQITPSREALDPHWACNQLPHGYDLLHLNYHMALHSRWTPEVMRNVRAADIPVVLTLHDSGVPNSDRAQALHGAADVTIVHEPVEDLPGAIYLRQGVPGWSEPTDQTWYDIAAIREWACQPVLGTVGFPFPWKNYDRLAEATARAGWALLLLAPRATPDQIAGWRRANPATLMIPTFIPAETVVAYLAGCDATAFLYSCANTGTSGAIRQGIAARKPVLATAGCRQFRDLWLDRVGADAICWVEPTVEALVDQLAHTRIARVDPAVGLLAEQDSWARVGFAYAHVFHRVTSGRGSTSTQAEGAWDGIAEDGAARGGPLTYPSGEGVGHP